MTFRAPGRHLPMGGRGKALYLPYRPLQTQKLLTLLIKINESSMNSKMPFLTYHTGNAPQTGPCVSGCMGRMGPAPRSGRLAVPEESTPGLGRLTPRDTLVRSCHENRYKVFPVTSHDERTKQGQQEGPGRVH